MEKKYTVYKHTFPNGKVYIGITKQKPKKRWASGHGYSHYKYRNRQMFYAIQEYTWENVSKDILFEGLTKEEAYSKEIELIAQYDSTNPDKGYNISPGGYTVSDKQRESIRETSKRKYNDYLQGKNNHQKKQKNFYENFIIRARKKVLMFSLDGELISEYESCHDASKKTGILTSMINKSCNTLGKFSSGGYLWLFKEYYDEQLKLTGGAFKLNYIPTQKKVIQLTLNGEFVNGYDNAIDASNLLGISASSVRSTCLNDGIHKSAGGYMWMYKDEYDKKLKNNEQITPYKFKLETIIKKAVSINTSTFETIIHDSTEDASNKTGIKKTIIHSICNKKQKKSGNYTFLYKEEYENLLNLNTFDGYIKKLLKPQETTKRKPCVQISLDGNILNEYESTRKAAKTLGLDKESVRKCCLGKYETAGGFIWMYKDELDKKPIPKNVILGDKRKKPITQYDLNGNFIREWESVSQVKKDLNFLSSNVHAVCVGNQKTAYGFIWKYKGDTDLSNNISTNKRIKMVLQYDLDNNLVKKWGSISEAEKELKLSHISAVCNGRGKTAGGFIWKYAEEQK
jgi:hypothetical protein